MFHVMHDDGDDEDLDRKDIVAGIAAYAAFHAPPPPKPRPKPKEKKKNGRWGHRRPENQPLPPKPEDEVLSEYEKARLENIKRNQVRSAA
eukprot:SAG22_NODE_1198_length_5193_cov_12.289360_5_plen_90_part_00